MLQVNSMCYINHIIPFSPLILLPSMLQNRYCVTLGFARYHIFLKIRKKKKKLGFFLKETHKRKLERQNARIFDFKKKKK